MLAIAILISAVVTLVCAESHSIQLRNYCGYGEAVLVVDGNVVLRGCTPESNPPWPTDLPKSGVAYLQDGNCTEPNGEGCTVVEWTLSNLASNAGISLTPPYAFNVGVEFRFDSCFNIGNACLGPNCTTAIDSSDKTGKILTCEVDNVGLVISFCPATNSG